MYGYRNAYFEQQPPMAHQMAVMPQWSGHPQVFNPVFPQRMPYPPPFAGPSAPQEDAEEDAGSPASAGERQLLPAEGSTDTEDSASASPAPNASADHAAPVYYGDQMQMMQQQQLYMPMPHGMPYPMAHPQGYMPPAMPYAPQVPFVPAQHQPQRPPEPEQRGAEAPRDGVEAP